MTTVLVYLIRFDCCQCILIYIALFKKQKADRHQTVLIFLLYIKVVSIFNTHLVVKKKCKVCRFQPK